MTRRALLVIAALALIPVSRLLPIARPAQPAVVPLPGELSSQDFWTLSTALSEPDGEFRSDNLVSNELFMQRVIPELTAVVRTNRAYLGVGPEQNYTYIAAVKPSIAFIVDIRRGNLRLHMMYKALFALSSDRVEFVSRLFSMKRPPGLDHASPASEIFAAFGDPQLRSEDLYRQNIADMREYFARKEFGLSPPDLDGILEKYSVFYMRGTSIHYEVTPGSYGAFPTYAEVLSSTDGKGVERSFLASEDRFAFVKSMHARNLIVPVVGNFGGPKAIRAVGTFLERHGTIVGSFYVSNVEQYLVRDGGIERFCASVAHLPLDDSSTFIRSERWGFTAGAPRRTRGFGASLTSKLQNMKEDVMRCGPPK